MKNGNLLVATIIALATYTVTDSPASGQTCTTTFEPDEIVEWPAWQWDANWDAGVPTSSDFACIPDGLTARVRLGVCTTGDDDQIGKACNSDEECTNGTCDTVTYSTDIEAGAFLLSGEPREYNLRLESFGSSLTLYGHYTCHDGPNHGNTCVSDDDCIPGGTCLETPSRLEGTLYLDISTTLVIANDLTIEGDGGILEGEFGHIGSVPPVITGNGKLTLKGDNPTITCHGGPLNGVACDPDWNCPGGWCNLGGTCEGGSHDGDHCDCPNGVCRGSLLLTEEWTVEVEFVNDNANVWATHYDGITLTGGKKSGSGIWETRTGKDNGIGLLVIDCEVDLGGDSWRVGGFHDATPWRIATRTTMRIDPNGTFSNWTGDMELSGNRGPLEIDKSGASVPWNFLLSGGALIILDNFSTTGDLEMTGGEITVAEGKVAQFDWP